MLSAEGMAGEGDVGGRAYGEARYTRGGARGLTLRMKAGIASPDVAPQLRFRLGGMHTVRGFEYASLTGESFWAAQLDVSPSRGTIRPVLFADVGGIGGGRDAPTGLEGRVLAGGGIGVSMYSPLLRTTLIRVDVSHPITPSEGGEWRFDLVFSPVR
jgi:hemolysin activation/secretion protein